MRYVTSIILYDNEKLLFQHRDSNAPTLANQWGHFGGHIEEGETPLDCVKREAFEEIEYELKNPQFVKKVEFTDQIFYLYVEQYDNSQVLNQHEGDYLKWFDKEEIKQLNLHYKIDILTNIAMDYLFNNNF